MTQIIVNIVQPVVISKVEEVLERYPATAYEGKIASSAFKEKLIAYVLRRFPAVYVYAEATDNRCLQASTNCVSRDQQMQIEDLVYEGIHSLMDHRPIWQTTAQNAMRASDPSPSHWFG